MSAPKPTYALILAGGSGTRFWPLSRDARAKQLLDLFGEGTLLEQAVQRLEGIVPNEQILILTNAKQADAVRALLSALPPENIVVEPARRDTGPAVALGIGLVAARDPDALMIVLPADQRIGDRDGFRSVIQDALASAAATDGLVTVGIQPTWPCPSYGYIERGNPAVIPGQELANPPHEVKTFREKPRAEVAEEFLRQGGFTWNAGMFVWSVPVVIQQLSKHAPDLAGFVETMVRSDDLSATIAADFPELEARSIDYALMEKADRVLNIEASFDWDDVGSWISIAKYLGAYGDENRSNTPLTEIGSSHNIVFNARPESRIALLGVEDLIVVQTEDALLIAKRDQADGIKELAPLLPGELR